MNINKLNSIRVCWILIIPYVLLDFITGFSYLNLGIDLKLTILTKMLLLTLVLVSILRLRFNLGVFLFTVSGVLLSIPFLRFAFIQDQSALFYEISILLKIILLLMMFAFSYVYSQISPEPFIKKTRICLYISFVLVSLNVLFGYLGIGHPTYQSTGLGFKGFFRAGNELSALYIVLSTFIMYEFILAEKYFKSLLITIVVLIVSLSIGTKSSAIYGVAISVLLPLSLFKGKIFSIRYLPFISLFFVSVFIAFYYSIIIYVDVFFQKYEYILSNQGLVGLIFSGRDLFAEEYVTYIGNDFYSMYYILGGGAALLEDVIGFNTIESDPFDIFALFGLLVLFLLLSFFSYIVFLPARLIELHYAIPVFFVNFSLLLFSFIAGHVWTSGMLSIAWALLNGLFFTQLRLRGRT
ncbi:O-antigen ligase family protein [Vibrio cyclitrophicus]|uniref:O-antigen ligase family protein n=1 Tax=Vibrio cyclitrophicus TaxID=47951 RepID=UPI0012FFF6ED|nr:O-antigen ligase family protein [Vibrio cyclitrophicus]